MFRIFELFEWLGWLDLTRWYHDRPFRGIGIFGVEPSAPKPPVPDAPPIRPCPYDRDPGNLERPIF